jgi:hypothetical protein
MLPNESTAPVPVRTDGPSAVASAPASDFDARWEEWRVAAAAAIAYTRLRP